MVLTIDLLLACNQVADAHAEFALFHEFDVWIEDPRKLIDPFPNRLYWCSINLDQ